MELCRVVNTAALVITIEPHAVLAQLETVAEELHLQFFLPLRLFCDSLAGHGRDAGSPFPAADPAGAAATPCDLRPSHPSCGLPGNRASTPRTPAFYHPTERTK